jgi:hypothetical protein
MCIYAVLISILKYCFIVELFEKWRSTLPPPPVARSIWASYLGVLAAQLGVSPRVKAPNPDATQGGGVAWVALWLAFPNTQRILVLLNYMTSGPFSLCYFLLLTRRFF